MSEQMPEDPKETEAWERKKHRSSSGDETGQAREDAVQTAEWESKKPTESKDND